MNYKEIWSKRGIRNQKTTDFIVYVEDICIRQIYYYFIKTSINSTNTFSLFLEEQQTTWFFKYAIY